MTPSPKEKNKSALFHSQKHTYRYPRHNWNVSTFIPVTIQMVSLLDSSTMWLVTFAACLYSLSSSLPYSLQL
jgi:hypothetical protein